jgi:hypothetical protein
VLALLVSFDKKVPENVPGPWTANTNMRCLRDQANSECQKRITAPWALRNGWVRMALKGAGPSTSRASLDECLRGPTGAHPYSVASLGKLTDALMLPDALRTGSKMTNIIVYSHSGTMRQIAAHHMDSAAQYCI